MATRRELGHRGALRARQLLAELKIRSVEEIDVDEIAALHDLFVIDGGLVGAQGRLIHRGNKGIIRIQTGLTQAARRRYTIVHELGHRLLHPDRLTLCAERDMIRYEPGNAETEANAFAAELLMPRQLFEPHCDVARPTLDVVKGLADKFGATFTATAIRFAELCPEACAVVWSESSAIKWAIGGPDFPFIRFGMPLSRDSHAYDAFRGETLPKGLQEVPASAWVERCRSTDIFEESVVFSSLKAVFTLLWLRDAE